MLALNSRWKSYYTPSTFDTACNSLTSNFSAPHHKTPILFVQVVLIMPPGHAARGHASSQHVSGSSSPNSPVLFKCDRSCQEGMADARCYAARYPDLRALCADGAPCRAELLDHFVKHGREEGRTYHCFRPTPYASNRNNTLRLWPPEGAVPSAAAANKSVILFRHVEKTTNPNPSPNPSSNPSSNPNP